MFSLIWSLPLCTNLQYIERTFTKGCGHDVKALHVNVRFRSNGKSRQSELSEVMCPPFVPGVQAICVHAKLCFVATVSLFFVLMSLFEMPLLSCSLHSGPNLGFRSYERHRSCTSQPRQRLGEHSMRPKTQILLKIRFFISKYSDYSLDSN